MNTLNILEKNYPIVREVFWKYRDSTNVLIMMERGIFISFKKYPESDDVFDVNGILINN